MAKATWNGQVVAESDSAQKFDGNVYFPPDAMKQEFFKRSDHTTVCGWKGTANYYTLVVDGEENANACWYYADPKPEAKTIAGHVAFWKGVKVEE